MSSTSLACNVLRLGVVADFTTNVDTKHTVQIYEKLLYEAHHPPFCQTAVVCSYFLKLLFKSLFVKLKYISVCDSKKQIVLVVFINSPNHWVR